MPETDEEFTFTYEVDGKNLTVKEKYKIPFTQGVEEYSEQLSVRHGIPSEVKENLKDELQNFISVIQKKQQDKDAEEALAKLKAGAVTADGLVKKWTKTFSEVLQHASPEPVSNEVVFSEVYHSLIHSPALETLLNLEHTYSLAMGEMTKQRDKDLLLLEKRQRDDMEDAINKLGTSYTDEQINLMAQRHFENIQLIQSKWASEILNLQQTQKKEYRNWVMDVHEVTHANDNAMFRNYRPNLPSRSLSDGGWEKEVIAEPRRRREESFTVHLGAQLKTMHNLRLVCADVLEFCRHRPVKSGGMLTPQPQRLQTAMSLYSNQLCGLILLVDNRLSSYTGMKREFAKVCEQSTDFHFRNLEDQFEVVEGAVASANEWRTHRKVVEEDSISLRSTGSDHVSLRSTASGSSDKDERNIRLQSGDVYVTRHSNLAEAHVVFHLVADDSVGSIQSEISSRHPVILGIRNIVRACYHCDVTSVSLPLLLVQEMSEEMTINWCLKRAELVFKCVKGFMMEFATWNSGETRTIQFIVPKGLSYETFTAIATMLPSIFRMSNPVTAKS